MRTKRTESVKIEARRWRRAATVALCLAIMVAQQMLGAAASKADTTVETIEVRMQEQYGIGQVDLGEMTFDMAKQVEAAFSYMYGKYPVLQGQLTNLTLDDIDSDAIAVTEYTEDEEVETGKSEDQLYPIVMKHQIVLNARDFLNEKRMNNQIRMLTSEGYWIDGTTVTALVVHELGHVLIDTIRMQQCGLTSFSYITTENAEAYAAYNTDVLAMNQTTTRGIVCSAWENAKTKIQETDGGEADMEEAMLTISGYAGRKQDDGGFSYDETCAEAIADVYIRGENCADFSAAIVDEMQKLVIHPISGVIRRIFYTNDLIML